MDVNEFLKNLAGMTASPMSKNTAKQNTRTLEKISLNFDGNFGRYQLLPMNDVVTDEPFIPLFNTREICVPRKNVAPDGTETTYNAWIKILPKDCYKMRDSSGRITSSLTSEEERQLMNAYSVFDELWKEIGAKEDISIARGLMRKRNYTIFNAYCLNKWDFEDSRQPKRSKFCGLFVCTAKGFVNAVEDNISEMALLANGNTAWVGDVYNRQTSNRNAFVLMSISRSKTSAGYTVTVQHKTGANELLRDVVIAPEDEELMQNPLETFLGWQARREDESVKADQRRLFNSDVINEAINYCTQQLAAVRMAKSAGTSIQEAIQATTETAINATAPVQTTNDPMLQNNNAAQPQVNAQEIAAKNTDPFSTPAAAHLDPLSGAPVNNNPQQNFGGFGGFNAGTTGFGGFNNGGTEGDMPF